MDNEQENQEAWKQIFDRYAEARGAELVRQMGEERTPQCILTALFNADWRGGPWTAEQLDHISRCKRCTRLEAAAKRVECEEAEAASPVLNEKTIASAPKLVEDLLEPENSTIVSVDVRTAIPGGKSSFTSLMKAGRGPELAEALEPWLPFMLRWVGLDESLVERFLVFMKRQLPQVQGQEVRFRDQFIDWLEAFAYEEGLASFYRQPKTEDYGLIIESAAVERVLCRSEPDEPAWTTKLRASIRRKGIHSADALLALEPPSDAPAAGDYCVQLSIEAYRFLADARSLFQP